MTHLLMRAGLNGDQGMARIPDSEIERLKKEVPIERLVMGFGVELKRHGVELIGTCPFH